MTKILAIDDVPDNLVSITALLKIMIGSCDILTADSGQAGIDIAARECPDVILLDIHMPEMDGFETCRILKSRPDTQTIPVVILTALKTGSHHRIKALELGADAFLTKPINEAELAAQVKAMLRIKAAEDRLRNENERLEILVRKRYKDLLRTNEKLRVEMNEREAAQKTLAESETRFKTMIEKSPLPTAIINVCQEVLFLNETFVERFGYTQSDIPTIDTWWKSAYPDENYREKARNAWKTVIRNAETSSRNIGAQVWEISTKAGKKRICEFSMVPLGEVYLVVINDITDRVAVETQRMQLEKQLQQAQKMEAVGALAGGIAHDFNNILSPLIGFTEILKDDIPEDSPLNESVDEILKAALRARDLVMQILSFGRQMDQEIKPVKIQAVVKEVIRLSTAIIPATISIVHDIDKNCRQVLADPSQIHQLVMNLITNAYHAMQDSGGTLTISLKEGGPTSRDSEDIRIFPGEYVCLTVKDTGVGMSEKVLSRVFDPYFTTKGLTKGTGLGLSVVHGIIKNCKGKIRVNSRVGKGSEFMVYFPLAGPVSQAINEHASPDLPGGEGRILLVDDEPNTIKIEKQMLKRLGYEVTPMDNPVDALELFSARPFHFDLVITDMTMPDLTGDMLAIKLLDIRPSLPIIICTGFSDLIDTAVADRIGIHCLLMKPILKSSLAHAVKGAMEKKDKIKP
ncbi:MAG: response regulator [Desulfobacterales bacterium]|nr:response regulator [Desulfobacterales bacterium]